jgi:hypothetical protein
MHNNHQRNNLKTVATVRCSFGAADGDNEVKNKPFTRLGQTKHPRNERNLQHPVSTNVVPAVSAWSWPKHHTIPSLSLSNSKKMYPEMWLIYIDLLVQRHNAC